MMNIGGSSSVPPVEWGINDIVVDLDSWFDELLAESSDGSLTDFGVDTKAITPSDTSQPISSTINCGANLGENSSNVSQSDFWQEMMAESSLIPNSSTTTMQNEGILSSAVKFMSNISAQSSQSQINTDFPQYQPLHQDKGKAVEQPKTFQLADQSSNLTLCDQLNQLQSQMLSNQFLPCTLPMVVNTQTVIQQNDESLRVQVQKNLNQIQSQLQKSTASFGDFISGPRQLGVTNNLNLSAPVGFATPAQFISTTAYRDYVLRQIKKMKVRYNNELLKMHYNAMELRSKATNTDVADNYQKAQLYLERMMTFLNISRVDLLPRNDETLYNYMNTIVNYVCYHMNRRNGEPVLIPSNGPQVQPVGPMMLQNLEAKMLNFTNFPSKRPHPQSTLSRMSSSSSVDNISSQAGQQSSVLSTIQQTNSGPKTSGVIGSSSSVSLFTNTTATNFPSRQLNNQPQVENKNINLEKMIAPMPKAYTGSKARHGMSPFSTLMNQMNPNSSQQTSVSLSGFDVNKAMSPLSIICSPFLHSSRSSTPSTLSSGISSSSTIESQKDQTPIDPNSKEPKNSKDQLFHLTEVVKSVSPNVLRSTLNDIRSMEKATDIIEDELSVIFKYDHQTPQKMKREYNVASVHTDEFVSDQGNTSETSTNKRIKIEKQWALMEEIKETNRKLLQTSINVMIDSDSEEEDINMLGAHEGTIVKCVFKNVCFPGLLDPHGHVTSEKMPEFVILFLVPTDYPASPPKISRSSRNVLNSEPWGKLYEEMLTKFDLSLYGVTGKSSLGDMARNWDASVRDVLTEFMKKSGLKSFSSCYGRWENCIKSSN